MQSATGTISLSPLDLSHAAAMYKWMLDPEVSKNIGLRSTPTLERTRDWIRRAQQSNSFLPFAICHMGRHVGNLIFDEIDPLRSSARLSIYIGEPDDRGKGFGTEAIRSALATVLAEPGFSMIWLTVHRDNARAFRAYSAIGFRTVEALFDDTSYRMELSRAAWDETQGDAQ